MTIRELPFRERPLIELLHLEDERDAPDPDYAGYGWARAERIVVGDTEVADALVLALHSADDGEALADDIELEFELPGRASVTVLASQFLAVWLPQLPHGSAIVLAMCNPHDARLALPPAATAPVYYATGDVESWQEREGGRIHLAATGAWVMLAP